MPVALAVNDDGIDSIGLRSLVEELSKEGFRVYVAAPAHQMSGISKTVSFNRFGRNGRIEYKELDIKGALKSWALNATPAESVLVALRLLLEEKPDIVVSGVNIGPNMGLEDILSSGTVGAAIEAVLNGIQAVAVSLAREGRGEEHEYRLAARIAAKLSRPIVSDGWEGDGFPKLINMNIPPDFKGIMVTRPSINNYKMDFKIDNGVIEVARNKLEERYWDRRPGTDVWAVLNGYASISVIDIFNLLEFNENFKSNLGDIIRKLENVRIRV